jgi:hypothetical protein
MRKLIPKLFTAALVLAAAPLTQAQAHYPAGVEGVKAATLPPPGWYLRDYNYLYWADDFPGGPSDFDLFAYVQAPRYDLSVGYGFWAPSGDFDPQHPSSPGKGYWTHMLTAGATWYFDEAKTWALSALNRYEINHENSDTDITPGQVWTLEAGASKTLGKFYDLGVVGYYQTQTTADSGPGADDGKDYAVAVGPEFNAFFPKLGLLASARYFYELKSHDRPEGHTVNITLTKIF